MSPISVNSYLKVYPQQSEQPKRRGRKPGSKNKPKVKTDSSVTNSRKIKDSMSKMVAGTKVIYWNDNKINFSIGRYVRPNEDVEYWFETEKGGVNEK